MEKALAQLLTTALVQFIDRERPEGSMCCSNTECANLENSFNAENFIYVEAFVKRRLPNLTKFEDRLVAFALQCNGEFDVAKEEAAKWSKELLDLAKKELLSYPDESNPAIEAMADLERTYFNDPDKLPKWLKDDIAKKELNAHTKGYYEGYKVAEKRYNESVTYHFPIMPTPPSGWGCDGTHCTNPHHDCINCPVKYSSGGTITAPNTASGTSTATLHGNTSATDGKEHNPSFID